MIVLREFTVQLAVATEITDEPTTEAALEDLDLKYQIRNTVKNQLNSRYGTENIIVTVRDSDEGGF
jgi:hypothetical protein